MTWKASVRRLRQESARPPAPYTPAPGDLVRAAKGNGAVHTIEAVGRNGLLIFICGGERRTSEVRPMTSAVSLRTCSRCAASACPYCAISAELCPYHRPLRDPSQTSASVDETPDEKQMATSAPVRCDRRRPSCGHTGAGDLMGYGYYLLPDGREAGYGVEAECDREGCIVTIDRGLGYLCGNMPDGHRDDTEPGCGRYFCGEHGVDHDCPNPDGYTEPDAPGPSCPPAFPSDGA